MIKEPAAINTVRSTIAQHSDGKKALPEQVNYNPGPKMFAW